MQCVISIAYIWIASANVRAQTSSFIWTFLPGLHLAITSFFSLINRLTCLIDGYYGNFVDQINYTPHRCVITPTDRHSCPKSDGRHFDRNRPTFVSGKFDFNKLMQFGLWIWSFQLIQAICNRFKRIKKPTTEPQMIDQNIDHHCITLKPFIHLNRSKQDYEMNGSDSQKSHHFLQFPK